MKVKTINRNEEEYTRERSQDLKKVHRNYDPSLHQFKVCAAVAPLGPNRKSQTACYYLPTPCIGLQTGLLLQEAQQQQTQQPGAAAAAAGHAACTDAVQNPHVDHTTLTYTLSSHPVHLPTLTAHLIYAPAVM
jgi:hypothetical protein